MDGFRQYHPKQPNVPQQVHSQPALNPDRPQPKTSGVFPKIYGSYSDPPPMPKFGSYFSNGQSNIRQT